VAIDPYGRQYLAQAMMGATQNYRSPNPWGNAFNALANVLAQRNFAKSGDEIRAMEEAERKKAEEAAAAQLAQRQELFSSQGIDPSLAQLQPNDPLLAALLKRQMPDAERQKLMLKEVSRTLPDGTIESAMAGFDPFTGARMSIGEWRPQGTVADKRQSVTVNVNDPSKIPLEKSQRSSIQGDIVDLTGQMADLDEVASLYSDDYLTLQGKAEGGLAKAMDKVGLSTNDQKAFLGRKRKFTQGVNQLFNAYRSEITGAAASEQELERLKDAMLSEDLSPAEFQAAYVHFRNKVGRDLAIKKQLLNSGIDVSEVGEYVDAISRNPELIGELVSHETVAQDMQMEQAQQPMVPAMIPDAAKAMLKSDPSDEAKAEFDALFGKGAAEIVLSQVQQQAVPRPATPAAPAATNPLNLPLGTMY
jgi:hypothetical protein